MFSNFFNILFRNLLRNKVFSIINILGLAIGFAACLIIYLYVVNEVSYDRYHQKGDRIYRLLSFLEEIGESYAIKPAVLYDHINEKVPGVEHMVRIFRYSGKMDHEDKRFNEESLKFADQEVFNIFGWKFIAGDPDLALADRHSIVLTERMAKKYFDEDNPLGRVLTLDNHMQFTVTGVIEDVPENSHFNFDFLGSSKAFEVLNPSSLTHWGNQGVFIYMLLQPGADVRIVEQTIDTIYKQSHPQGNRIMYQQRLQPLHDIHLYSASVNWDISSQGDINNIYGFSIIAFLVLLIACFNFTNLTTASATSRAREVGIRKVIGANRRELIIQFISETMIYALLSLILAVLIVEISLPFFNDLAGKNLKFSFSQYPNLYWIIPCMVVAVSLLAGLYPALVLSRFKPVTILKGSTFAEALSHISRQKVQLRLRQVLIVLQFTITIGLIVSAILINRQMEYVNTKFLGFNREAIVVIENPWDQQMYPRYKELLNRLSGHTAIKGVAGTHNIPGRDLNNYISNFHEKSKSREEGISTGIVSVDTAFFRVMGSRMISGTDFTSPVSGDPERACIVNEELLRLMDVREPVGLVMTGFDDGVERRIVGVVNNIHYMSLHEKVRPAVYINSAESYPPFTTNLVVRLSKGMIAEGMALVEESWAGIAPEWPIEAFFLDQRLDDLYRDDQQVMKVVNVFTLLAIVISLMGLFGLTLFVMRSRTKEIGIRQVHGATAKNLMQMFTGEFALLVLLSNIIAWPVAYWFLINWIEKFAFRIHIGIYPFLLAGVVTLLLALLMVGWHVVRTLAANPVNALRYE
ncbi:MAG: FtsX-like permease family protein [Bacteroidota bacterium]